MNEPRRAVFLDKDGTLVVNVPYNVDPALIRLAPGAEAGLCLLRDAGYALFVVSNQSGVARGYFPEASMGPVVREIGRLLSAIGVPLEGFAYCPHHPDGVVAEYAIECECRKPRPGMILGAALGHGIDLGRSWLVGDILDDVEAGRRAGCRTVLIDNGNETEWVSTPERRPHGVAADLLGAAQYILAADRAQTGASGPGEGRDQGGGS